MLSKWKIILLHVVLIVLFQSIPILSSPDFDFSTRVFSVQPFLRNFFGYSLIICFYYLHAFLLLPNLFEKGKKIVYTLSVLLGFVAISMVIDAFFPNSSPLETNFIPPKENFPMPPARNWFNEWFQFLGLLAPFLMIVLFSHALHLAKKSRQMELDKAEAELQNLKYQLQPHFLFNSLNNIYSVSIIDPSKTPNYILNLSELLRYLLKTEHLQWVELEQEVHFCQQYIALQQLRYGKKDRNWKISWPSKDEMNGIMIPPFLLLPFIENVFKYGVHPSELSDLKIKLKVDNLSIHFETENQKMNVLDHQLLSSQGLGLNKTKQRIQLLYGSLHHFEVKETETSFNVQLMLKKP